MTDKTAPAKYLHEKYGSLIHSKESFDVEYNKYMKTKGETKIKQETWERYKKDYKDEILIKEKVKVRKRKSRKEKQRIIRQFPFIGKQKDRIVEARQITIKNGQSRYIGKNGKYVSVKR